MLLSICMVSSAVITAAGADDIDSLESQLEELERQNEEYQAILDQTNQDIADKEEYSEALVGKIEVLDEKIALAHEKIEELNSNIAEKEADIEQANADIETQMETLRSRIRMIYMAGNASDLEIILGAKDFSDFLDKMELVKSLSAYDSNLIGEIKEKLEEISEEKEALESDKSELEEEEAQLEADQEELNTLLEENEALLASLYEVSSEAKSALENGALESEEIENAIAEYYAEQAALAAAQAAAQAAAAAQGGSSSGGSSVEVSSSGYTWPCPGYYYLSSEWNEDRGSYNHGAIDIAGGGIMGATVVAACSGTVVSTYTSCYHNWGKSGSCGCGGNYGNYVMIDHGNGKMTIYAHLSSVAAVVGQTVSAGQTIGYVGSTGESTGPHLHFECRLNGVRYNPMIEFN